MDFWVVLRAALEGGSTEEAKPQLVKAWTDADLGDPSITARSPTTAPGVMMARESATLTCGEVKLTLSRPLSRRSHRHLCRRSGKACRQP